MSRPSSLRHVSVAMSTCFLAFVVLAAGPPRAAALLEFAQGDINVQSGARAVALGDVNGDGFLDIVAANVQKAGLSLALGNGDGTFHPPRFYDGSATAVAVVDVNKDGRADVVALDPVSVTVRLGRRDGSLGRRRVYDAGRRASGLAVADTNRDGRKDIVTCDRSTDKVSVRLGRGDGTFRAPTTFAAGDDPRAVLVIDVNHDRRADLVLANYAQGRIGVRLRTSTGTYGRRKSYPVCTTIAGLRPFALAAGDLNGDKHVDLAIANQFQSCTSVLFGRGDGRFRSGTALAYDDPRGVALADLTGDGALDIVATQSASMTVTPGVGDGTFRVPQSYAWGSSAFGTGGELGGVAVGDLNGDHLRDIVAITGLYDDMHEFSLHVFLNRGLGPFSAVSRMWDGTGLVNSLGSADMDCDGRLDALVGGPGVLICYGNGKGAADQFVSPEVGGYAADAVAGRLDDNDSLDIAYAALDGVGVLLATGPRSFAAPVVVTDGATPARLALGDLDGDGDLDLVGANYNNENSIGVRLNDGHGAFGPQTPYTAMGHPADVAVADVNEDGKSDVVVANKGLDLVSVFFGLGDGTLGTRLDYPGGTDPEALLIADFNGDEHLDIATDAISVLLGNGDGTFATSTDIPTLDSIEVGDFNSDGIVDILTSARAYDTTPIFRVLLGNGDGTFDEHVTPGRRGLLEAGDFNADGHVDVMAAFWDAPVDVVLGTGVYE